MAFEPDKDCYCSLVANPQECRDAGYCIMAAESVTAEKIMSTKFPRYERIKHDLDKDK